MGRRLWRGEGKIEEGKRKGRQEEGKWRNCSGTHLLAIPPFFKGQSGAVSNTNLELDWRACTHTHKKRTHTHKHALPLILSLGLVDQWSAVYLGTHWRAKWEHEHTSDECVWASQSDCECACMWSSSTAYLSLQASHCRKCRLTHTHISHPHIRLQCRCFGAVEPERLVSIQLTDKSPKPKGE